MLTPARKKQANEALMKEQLLWAEMDGLETSHWGGFTNWEEMQADRWQQMGFVPKKDSNEKIQFTKKKEAKAMLNLTLPLLDDYGASMTPHLESIETADENELLEQLKQYVSDEHFKKDLKALMAKAIRKDWDELILKARLEKIRIQEEA